MPRHSSKSIRMFIQFLKDILVHPMNATRTVMTFKQLIYFLFLISLPPALLQFFLIDLGQATVFDNFLFMDVFFDTPLFVIPLYMVTIIGCSILLAMLVQIVGRILGLLEFELVKTFAAIAYAMTPIATFGWIFFVFRTEFMLFSAIMLLTIRIGFCIWTFCLMVVGLMNQHKTTLLNASLSLGISLLMIITTTAAIGGTSYFYFLEMTKTEKIIDIFGIVCNTGLRHSITVSNAGTMVIESIELKVYVDGSEAICEWSGNIAPGRKATCETTMLTEAGSHKVKVVGPSNSVEGFSYCV